MQPSSGNEPVPPDDMVTECSGRVLLIRCGATEPSEAAWRRFLALIRARPEVELRGFVVTGGAPSTRQQKALQETLAGRTLPFAIMTDDVKVRFVTSIMAMVTKRIRSFAPSDIEGACAYLELTPEERRKVIAFAAAAQARAESD